MEFEFAYLDESGDSGEKGSEHLVLALMCTARKKNITRIITDAKKRLLENNKSRKWLNRRGGEIKFCGFPDKNLLKRTLQKLSNLNICVYFIAIRKNRSSIGKETKTLILGELFHHIFEVSNNKKPHKIIADLNFFNKEKENWFLLQKYDLKTVKVKGSDGKEKISSKGHLVFLRVKEEDYKKLKDNQKNFIVTITHQNSRLSEELQALDLICGSIFNFVEYNNPEYVQSLMGRKMKIVGSPLPEK